MRAVAACVLVLAAAGRAGETADVSLDREVDRYLEEAAPATPNPVLNGQWRNGPVWESADGDFMFRIRSRLLWDTVWRDSSPFEGVPSDETYFRQARLGVRGRVYRNTIFMLEVDFGLSQVSLMDVFVGLRRVPVLGTLTFGHQREPFSLDGVTPIPFHAFMERATPTIVFSPTRNTGVRAANHLLGDRLTWSAGIYREDDEPGSGYSESGSILALRVTGLPVRRDDSRTLLHIGFSFTARDPPEGIAQFDGRGGLRIGPTTIDTGPLPADRDLRAVVEVAYFWRSWRVQSEFFVADISGETNATFTGWYVFVSWWITGEQAKFLPKAATYARMQPARNLHDGQGGWGAWELGIRFSTVDLNDGSVLGGQQDDYTVGLNWHWNPHARIMLNVVYAEVVEGPAGTGSSWAFKVRTQFDF